MEYKTHTNLTLALIEDADGCRVTLTGDREKLVWQSAWKKADSDEPLPLARARVKRLATQAFNEVKEHYEARKTAQGAPDVLVPGVGLVKAESLVESKPISVKGI